MMPDAAAAAVAAGALATTNGVAISAAVVTDAHSGAGAGWVLGHFRLMLKHHPVFV